MEEGPLNVEQAREASLGHLCKAKEAMLRAIKIADDAVVSDLGPEAVEQHNKFRKKLSELYEHMVNNCNQIEGMENE